MKTFSWIAITLVLPFLTVPASAIDLGVSYDHAGLTQINVQTGHLRFVWHTLRKYDKPTPALQDMSSYDRHEVDIWLTDSEIDAISQWMKNSKVFDLPAMFPSKANQTYGSAFQTKLTVTLQGRKRSVAWDGDNLLTEEFRKAEIDFLRLCEGIRKDRDK